MTKRVTQHELDEAVKDLREIGQALEIDGAEYWVVENPFGPTGLYLLERHHDDGHWVSQSTALGNWSWGTKREALEQVRAMRAALRAALRATESGDRHSELHQAGTV